jgi:putative phosphoribosyl transferase
VVLGLPRGGVAVGFEVASSLGLPLDIMLVRKLGVPGERELAMGAIAAGGVRLLNEQVVQAFRLSAEVIDAVTAEEEEELSRRERLYRGGRPAPLLRGWTVILVDDGIATGATARAALQAAREQQSSRVVVAVPVVAADTAATLRTEADELVTLLVPSDFLSVGYWYEEFGQESDAEIGALLDQAWNSPRQVPPEMNQQA